MAQLGLCQLLIKASLQLHCLEDFFFCRFCFPACCRVCSTKRIWLVPRSNSLACHVCALRCTRPGVREQMFFLKLLKVKEGITRLNKRVDCVFDGACAHYIMVSKIQWKPFWLATQRDPQNDWTGWQNRVNYDVVTQAPFPQETNASLTTSRRYRLVELALLYSRKFSSAKNFVNCDRRAVRQEFIFVKHQSSLICSSVVRLSPFCLSFIFTFMNSSDPTLVVL